VADRHPEARRTIEEITLLSPPPRSFLAAPDSSAVWGEATAGVRDKLPWGPEQTLFPGALTLLLAVAGIAFAPWSRRLRLGLAGAVLVAAFFSMGLRVADGWLSYRLLYELAPGWEGIRTPGRINTLTSLGLALLASGGALALQRVVRRPIGAAAAGAAVLALALGIVVEGSGPAVRDPGRGREALKRVPAAPVGWGRAPEPRLHLPVPVTLDFSDYSNFLYTVWSTDGFPEIVNGTSGFKPRLLAEVEREVQGFPDRRSVAFLRRLGVRSVVMHRQAVRGTPWEGFEARPAKRLGLREQGEGELVLYDLRAG
jgi:hypothetical protein